jgi:GH18 family chitinase
VYSKGAVVGYKGVAYQAVNDGTYGIPPDSTVYTGYWKAIGVPDAEKCPVSIPNTINYGTAQPVSGNATAGTVRASATIGAARIANTASTIAPRSTTYSTDMGGDHPGFDADTGARVSKLAPGSLPLQHNTYTAQTSGQEIVSYLGDWAIYGRQWNFAKTPVKNLNRLVYGFAGICFPAAKNTQDPGFPTSAPAAVNRTCSQSKLPDGAIAIADFDAAFVRNLAGGQTPKVTGTEAMYDLNPADVGGVFGVLYTLRRANPNLKLDLSVGGWTLSEGFGWMARDATRRKAFVDSAVRFLQQFDFDGIDIDWEYPGSDGAVPEADTPADAANYVQLLKELRAGMDWLTVKTGKKYRLSSAIPATKGKLDIINWTEASKYMDRLYVMTYDLTGAWERNLSHHTPLKDNPNANGSSTGTSASTIIEYLNTRYGVPMNKLMIGAANYARSKRIVPGDITEFTNGLRGNTSYKSSVAPGTTSFILTIAGIGSWEAGVLENYDMYQNILDKDMKPRNGYKLYTDKSANADFLVHPNGSFLTIETPRTVALKTAYAKTKGLAGVFFWMIEQDNGYNLNAVNHVLGNPLVTNVSDGKPQDQIPTCGENVTAADCQALISSIR